MLVRVVFLLLLTFTGTLAHAESEDSLPGLPANISKLARDHYQSGVELYKAGDYAAARVEFQAAYDLCKLTGLLHNVSRAAELSGSLSDAIAFEQRFLTESKDLTEQEQDEARGRIGRLREKLEREQPAVPTPGEKVQIPSSPPSGRKGSLVGAGIGLGTGVALTLTGLGLMVATSLKARSIEQEPRTLADLSLALAQRDRLEAAAIGLSVSGPVVVVACSVILVKLKNRK